MLFTYCTIFLIPPFPLVNHLFYSMSFIPNTENIMTSSTDLPPLCKLETRHHNRWWDKILWWNPSLRYDALLVTVLNHPHLHMWHRIMQTNVVVHVLSELYWYFLALMCVKRSLYCVIIPHTNIYHSQFDLPIVYVQG